MKAIYEKDNLLERILRKTIAFVVVMAMVIPFMAPGVFAASSVSIRSNDNIKGGETFVVEVKFSGDNVGRVDAQLLYDTDDLTYVSGGTSKGNTGYVQLKSAGTGGDIVFNLKFQAVSDGAASIQVTTNEMYDLDERMMDNPSASKTINITGSADEEELITEPEEEEPVEPSSLFGVDEKVEEEQSISTATMMIISGAVLLILILIVIIVMVRKRKRTNSEKYSQRRYGSYDRADHDDKPRIGRSGRPLDTPSRRRDHSDTYRKLSNEDTEVWDNWNIDNNDDYKDIDKW